ncbi:uncharacterized protein LODBEIA_P04010 [Lodderomyces beijingensis]|uniref:Copper transport protein n=1 Tax=Lodderomyces beijingensis TaxID=1775926 RepID=A0ABP0ZDD2_9ASCO
MSQHVLETLSVKGDMPGHTMPGHDMPMPEDRCSMNMLFTWNWKNTCVVFKWWHIKTFYGFLISLVVVVLLGMGYEFIKAQFSKWERATATMTTSGLSSTQQKRFQLQRALVYGVQVFYSFWLMLVFMTYNGWFMLAVALGAAMGNYWFGTLAGMDTTSRTMACH